MLHCYRSDPAFVPELDLVMEPDGKLIGQVIYVRSEIDCDDGQRVPIMAFDPISIAPAYKRQGYGKRLLEKPFLLCRSRLRCSRCFTTCSQRSGWAISLRQSLWSFSGRRTCGPLFAAPAGEYQTDKPLSIKQKENFLKLTTLLLERVA